MNRTNNDSVITEEIARDFQAQLNAHCRILGKGLSIGANWRQTERVLDTIADHGVEVPPMYLLVKDHKKVDGSGLPPTRPVVSACASMGVHLTNVLSDILEPLANKIGTSFEFISTEDLLSKIDKHNTGLEDIKKHYGKKNLKRNDPQ